MRYTLGIETSAREGSIALLRDGKLVEQVELSQTGRRHARTLVAELKGMLDRAGVAPQQCEVVGISIGPGSFTGLRVGVTCAKTFAYATSCALVAVDTFHAIAAQSPAAVERVTVIAEAQRKELFLAQYARTTNGGWTTQDGIRILTQAEAIAILAENASLSGPAAHAQAASLGGQVTCLPERLGHPQAETIARLATERHAAGEADDVDSLEPKYIRKSAAEEQRA